MGPVVAGAGLVNHKRIEDRNLHEVDHKLLGPLDGLPHAGIVSYVMV